MEYEVLIAVSPDKLANLVQTFLDNDWEPQGGISLTAPHTGGILYAQAVVR